MIGRGQESDCRGVRPDAPTEAEFMQMLCRHDWHYHFSDDPDAYRTGQYMERRIMDAMANNRELKTLFALFEHESDLVAELLTRAKKNRRTLEGEILFRLEQTLEVF